MRYRTVLLLCLLLAAAVAARQPTGPPPKRVSFEASVLPLDPFSDENRVGATPTVRRGEVFLLTLHGVPREGYHTYPILKAAPGQEASQLSKLTIAGGAFAVAGPVIESEPKRPAGKNENKFDAPFRWMLPVVVRPTAEPGQARLTATAVVIACDVKGSCEPEKHTLSVPVVISDAPPLKLTPELEKAVRDAEARPTAPPAPTPSVPEATAAESFDYRQLKVEDHPEMIGGGTGAETGLAVLLVAAFLGGLISLATPCVFPMIPITVSIFVKQSEAGEGNAVLKAAVYSLTLVVVLSIGGIALGAFLQQVSQHWTTNVLLTGLFVFFGLSLLGMYDITLPSWLSDWTAAGEGKSGLLGIVFMAMTFSIVSFACVGPIYGGFTALSATNDVSGWTKRIAGPVAFSVAFAAPFFVLALFPGLLRQMPRSGSWMNTVKVVMGFLELAAAFKFLRGAEVNLWFPAKYFTFDLVLGVYVALALACGLYLLNLYRLPHDHDAAESIGVGRLCVALCFFSVAVYLLPGLFKDDKGHSQKPRGVLFDWTRSFLVPEDPSGWISNMPQALAQAQKEGKPLFIDFTAPG